MAGEFCPRCGTARVGSFRYCRACQFDFDSIPVAAPAGAPPAVQAGPPWSQPSPSVLTPTAAVPAVAPAQPKSGIRALRLVMVLVAVVLVVVVAFVSLGGLGGVPASANIPPVGDIWFGASFDTTTFELTGQTSTGHVGSSLALVAHLPQSISSGQADLQVSLNGTMIANSAVSMQGSGDVFGATTAPFVFAGTYRYEITDLGGNVLASGSVAVTSP